MKPVSLPGRRTALALGLGCLPLSALAVSLAVDSSLREIAARGVLRFGIDGDSAPFNVFENGRAAGYDIDVATHIARRLGLEPQFSVAPRERLIAGLHEGATDIVTCQTNFAASVGEHLRYSLPYVHTRAQLLVRTPGRRSIHGLEDLGGRRVGVIRGSVYEQIARQARRAVVLAYPGQREMLHDLLFGKINLVLDSSLMVRRYLREHAAGPIKAGGRIGPQLQTRLALRPQDAGLQHAIDEVLRSAAEDGSLGRISHKWFEADVFIAPSPPKGG